MGREDQLEEIEVLESIFPDELTKVDEFEFRVAIKLDLPDDVIEATTPADADPEDEYEAPVMVLSVKYPEQYPDVEPQLDLAPPPQQHEQFVYFSVADDKDALLAGLTETIEENMGMAMVFTIVSALKDAAEQLITTRHAAVVLKNEEAALAAEREENKKFHGTEVNPETFVKWQTDFLAEMAEKRRLEEEAAAAELVKKAKGSGPGGLVGKNGARLTGRQIWEQGLAGKIEEDDDDDAPTEELQKLKVEA